MQKMQEGHRHDKHYWKGRAEQLGRGSYFQAQRSSRQSRTGGSCAAPGPWDLAGAGAGRRGLAPTLRPQVLPGFSLLSRNHGSETTLAAPRACSPARPSFKRPPFTPRIQDHSLGPSVSHLTLNAPIPLPESSGPRSCSQVLTEGPEPEEVTLQPLMEAVVQLRGRLCGSHGAFGV